MGLLASDEHGKMEDESKGNPDGSSNDGCFSVLLALLASAGLFAGLLRLIA